jgi:hypothetical protein
MPPIRVTRGVRSRTPGTTVGFQVNTFGLDALAVGLTGSDFEPIAHEALTPAFEQAVEEWPVLTGASRDTIRVETDEVTETRVRVSLRVGGPPLIEDPRNTKHIDYAPFIEFNGSPGGTPPGIILYAMTSNDRNMRQTLHQGVAALIERRMRG